MNTQIVDTNVILRFLVEDHPSQFEQVITWFAEAEKGKRKLIIKPLVVAEACFVLESFYQQSRESISEAFEVFLSQKWLKVEDREVLLALWPWYQSNLHFVDSYLLAWAQLHKSEVLSFDNKLQKLSTQT